MTKTRILAFIFAAIFLLGFAAREPLSVAGFEWYLKGYCRACFGGNLSYSQVRHENGVWVFENPVLVTKTDLLDGGYRFRAEQLIIETSVQWLSRIIGLNVTFQAPHLDVGQGAQELKKALEHPCEEFRLFQIHTNFNVPKGSILVHSLAEDKAVPLSFSIDLACKEVRQGCLTLWMEEMLEKNQGIKLSLTEPKPNILQLSCDCQHISCSTFWYLLKSVWPQLAPLAVSRGSVEGKINLTFPTHANPYAEGHLVMRKLSLEHSALECTMDIPEMVLDLHSESSDGESASFRTVSYLEMPKEAFLQFSKAGHPFWTFQSFGGSLIFEKGDKATFLLDGFCDTPGKRREVAIEGSVSFKEEGFSSVSVDLLLKGQEKIDDSSFRFSARQLGEKWNFAEVEVLGFGIEEFDFAQHIALFVHPQWQKLKVLEGSVNAALLLYMRGFDIAEVKVEHMAAHHFQFAYEPLNIVGGVEDIFGFLSFDLSAFNPLETLNADLKIVEANLSISDLKNTGWQFADIHTNLAIRNGLIQKSLFKGNVAGLNGEIEIDEADPENLLVLNFNGKTKDLARVFPEHIKRGIDQKFSEDHIHVTATAKKQPQSLLFNGNISIENKNLSKDELAFGFSLEKASQLLWKRWPPSSSAVEYSAGPGLEALEALMPSLAAPISVAYRHMIKQNFGVVGLVIKEGWFKSQNLSLDKYISPFAFLDGAMQIHGLGDFSGYFDTHNIIVNYDVRDMVLETVDFVIEVKNLTPKVNSQDLFLCNHTFDLDKNCAFGEFPVANGTYFEKNSGLLFTDISTNIILENTFLHAKDLQTYSNGIFFAGDIDVDWSMPGQGFFDVDIKMHKMHGKMSQVQHLFSHFKQPLLFLHFPLEGDVTFRKEGGYLHFAFQPDTYELATHFSGTLSDGALTSQCGDLVLQEVSLNFEYDKKDNTLEFSDLQGTLLVGTPNHFEEYAIASDRIFFNNYVLGESVFDIWLGDKTRDILRLAGTTRAIQNQVGETFISFDFDHTLTHFGDVHPSQIELTLQDWSQIETFHLEFDFYLKTLLQDLQRFSRTGFLFLSRSLLKELNKIKIAEGSFATRLHYSGPGSLFTYNVEGSNVAVGTQHFEKFLLTGNKKGSVWTIDQLLLDEISLAADFLKEEQTWKINFLGARLGKSLLLGLEGEYSSENALLKTKVNLLEIDLSQLNEWPSLQQSLHDLNLGGQIRANGQLNLSFDQAFPKDMKVDFQGKGSLNEGRFKSLSLQNIDNISFHYDSNKGFEIKEIRTALKSLTDGTIKAGLYLEKACCDFINKEMQVEGLYFRMPSANLNWLADSLQKSFAAVVTPLVADTIRFLKREGDVDGCLRLALSKPHYALHMRLNDDTYEFMNEKYELDHFALDFDPFALKISTGYRYKNQHLWLTANMAAPAFNSGELILSDATSGTLENPLTFHWQMDFYNGYFIQKVTGTVCGIHCDLVQDEQQALDSDYLYLTGKVDLDMNKVQSLLSPEMAAKLASWEAGKGYTLQGHWQVAKDTTSTLLDRLTFQGELLGSQFEFFGYQFHHLSAHMNYSPQVLNISQLFVADPSGSLQLNEWNCFAQNNGQWSTMIPLLTISEFRPSLLRVIRSSPRRVNKTLVVRKLEIHDLHGIFGDKSSFKGFGKLNFVNPPKKDLQHTIFAIPAEILTRIGLDLAVLNPVRGSIEYELKEGKVLFNRFKDMYSKGRISKFYLPNNGRQSYMDFDGNLNLQVRMKQYNLIFKLAELFTVTVQGTLKKPTFTLQPQQYRGKSKLSKEEITITNEDVTKS